MAKENVGLDFPLKKYKTRKYLPEKIKQNDLMSEKHKVCRALNYFEHLMYLIFYVSAVNGYVSILHNCFISWCFCRHCELCSSIKNWCNNYRN